ncbi:MAG TPA: hypothetical protein VHU88_13425 [Sporichthyaceae bacterium]|nr:hypothetical protein [Sporichthyaceae bacterium]
MLRPTPGELLALTREALTTQVLPAVPAGAAARQLKAAIHILDQLERTWDLMPAYVAEDNADLRATLAQIGTRTGLVPTHRVDWQQPVPGVQDGALAGSIHENERLQADLDDIQQAWRNSDTLDPAVDALLFDLHQRMSDRARRAAGLQRIPPT